MSEVCELFRRAYALIADLWCNPQDVEAKRVAEDVRGISHLLGRVDQEAAAYLEQFLAHYPPSEEEYVELFELNPRCPLYLGSHAFEEPKTCAQAAVSDRNEYMIELIGIYKHFGLGLAGRELPDYLPLMVEFLALTVDVEVPIRRKFVQEYFLPFLPALRERLVTLNSPYLHLLDGLERLLKLDLEVRMKEEAHHV
ncbi:MAG: nitrate reductase molybdenum cofactor assembly chaperone [Armatimonadota bacterium]|nr:nitrate reductase molybdenum cofactor assembly chaperone [Armatimonadota bacterium]MDR5702514.1 nitrate reductase molybdenum cofactor assembly chaperone [Armatimonadota bacterium]MDR7434040.1 nitrate reductase molybdenum cofactor assembly chaperone [Armatimonadota bacterium]